MLKMQILPSYEAKLSIAGFIHHKVTPVLTTIFEAIERPGAGGRAGRQVGRQAAAAEEALFKLLSSRLY